ncbi:hypothetical protein ROZALSC1DRAFT_25322, partial [Rozella allomycis CSF55]
YLLSKQPKNQLEEKNILESLLLFPSIEFPPERILDQTISCKNNHIKYLNLLVLSKTNLSTLNSSYIEKLSKFLYGLSDPTVNYYLRLGCSRVVESLMPIFTAFKNDYFITALCRLLMDDDESIRHSINYSCQSILPHPSDTLVALKYFASMIGNKSLLKSTSNSDCGANGLFKKEQDNQFIDNILLNSLIN